MSNPKASAIARSPLQRLQDAGLVVVGFVGFDPIICDATLPDGKNIYFTAWEYSWELKITEWNMASLDSLFNLEVSYPEYSVEKLMSLETAADLILASIALYQLSSGKGAIA